MADDMTTEFYEYFINSAELNTKEMLQIYPDDDFFYDKLHEHLDNSVSYEISGYDAEKYVKEFGVFEAIQMKLDYAGELHMPYLDKNESVIDKNMMNRQLLFILLMDIAQQGYDDIYDMVRMNEEIQEDNKNEENDYINQISQMIIGF
jgi:hypothetical protein